MLDRLNRDEIIKGSGWVRPGSVQVQPGTFQILHMEPGGVEITTDHFVTERSGTFGERSFAGWYIQQTAGLLRL